MKIGALRRIDSLGRIVIPKSVRKTMMIKTGDSLQVYTQNKNIMIKKYSEMERIVSILKSVKKTLEKNLNKNIYITDNDKILLEKSMPLTEKIKDEIRTRKIIEDKEISISNNITKKITLFPIVVSGDIFGSILVESSKKLKEKEFSTIKIISELIINILED